MFYIETSGTWREMGRQFGETFADPLRECIAHYSPWLLSDPYPLTLPTHPSQLDDGKTYAQSIFE